MPSSLHTSTNRSYSFWIGSNCALQALCQHIAISKELVVSAVDLAFDPVTGYSPTDCPDLALSEAAESE
jgi:hypothetical protein